MFYNSAVRRVMIVAGGTDMRKSSDTLAALLAGIRGIDVLDGSLFCFCNKRKTIVKILWWEGNGFCLFQKKLIKECFDWPETEQQIRGIKAKELRWILDGLNINEIHPRGEIDRPVLV